MYIHSIVSTCGQPYYVGSDMIDFKEQIPIGQGHVVDMDELEEKWAKNGYLLFSYDGLLGTPIIYYIMVQVPTLSSKQWVKFNENDNSFDIYSKPFIVLLKDRFLQRLRTRKIIKEYKKEAKRRVEHTNKECELEVLLTMLKRVMPMKKGEEIYWFRDYEQALLEVAIEETKQALEYKIIQENKGYMKATESFTHTVEEIVNKQCC